MIGPYYRPQLTSILSITHRATGVFLSLVGAPLLLWWLAAISAGAEAYESARSCFSGFGGNLLLMVCVFSLNFHFLNGVRHLIWDCGYLLDIENAYRSGWGVLAASVVLTAVLLGVLL